MYSRYCGGQKESSRGRDGRDRAGRMMAVRKMPSPASLTLRMAAGMATREGHRVRPGEMRRKIPTDFGGENSVRNSSQGIMACASWDGRSGAHAGNMRRLVYVNGNGRASAARQARKMKRVMAHSGEEAAGEKNHFCLKGARILTLKNLTPCM